MLKKLFYLSLHLSVHLLESLRLGQPARAHSSIKDAGSLWVHWIPWHEDHRALKLKNEAPELQPTLFVTAIVIRYDTMWHKALTKHCWSFIFNLAFGYIFIWPPEKRSHFFSYDEHFRNGNSTQPPQKKSVNECIVFANRMRSLVFPWCASHGMWHYMLKKAPQKVEKVNINCLIQFEGCVHSVSGSAWLKGWQTASCLCCHEGAIIHV